MGLYDDTMKMAEEMKSPRFLKTHLSYGMMPEQIMQKKVKLIYVVRNPRDVCLSYCNHWKVLEGYTGSLETFVDAFLNDQAGYYTPFIGHVLEFWEAAKVNDNILFISYEELKADLPYMIKKVAKFLGVAELSEDEMAALCDHLSFDKMKNNDMVNKQELVTACNSIYDSKSQRQGFMRQGRKGAWREKLSADLVQRFEAWERKWLEGSDFRFQYD